MRTCWILIVTASLLMAGIAIGCMDDADAEEPEFADGQLQYRSWNGGLQVTGPVSDSITDLWIPGSVDGKPVKSIGYGAFRECTSLRSVSLPGTIEDMNDSAFFGCTSLSEVELRSGIEVIGNWAFGNCTSLRSIEIPSSVVEIGVAAFADSAIESVTLAEGLETIDNAAFTRCNSLVSIDIPGSVRTIGNQVFQMCSSLTDVTIGGRVDMGSSVFDRTAIVNISIPAGSTYGDSLFSSCENLESFTVEGSMGEVPSHMFRSCTSLTSVTVEEGVTSVGNYAFNGCDSLRTLVLPQSVTSIGYGAVGSCTLDYLDIGNSSLRVDMFSYTSVKELKVGQYTSVIENGVIRMIEGLESIDIPEGNMHFVTVDGVVYDRGLTHIVGCPRASEVVEVTIPDSIRAIPNSAFFFCDTIESVWIPDSVTVIGESAFYDCSALEEVRMPSRLTEIGASAFNSCMNLSHIDLPAGLTRIEDWTFTDCRSLDEVIIPNGVTYVGIQAFAWAGGERLVIPDTVSELGAKAFYVMENVRELYIPGSVGSISADSFQYMSAVETLKLGEGIESIGSEALLGFNDLASLDLPSTLVTVEDGAVDSRRDLTVLFRSSPSIGPAAFDVDGTLTVITSTEGLLGDVGQMDVVYQRPAEYTLTFESSDDGLDLPGPMTVYGGEILEIPDVGDGYYVVFNDQVLEGSLFTMPSSDATMRFIPAGEGPTWDGDAGDDGGSSLDVTYVILAVIVVVAVVTVAAWAVRRRI